MAFFSTVLTRFRGRALGGALAFATGSGCLAPAYADEPGSVSASYAISISGITVGRADAELRLKNGSYSMALRGFTSGVSRLVSDANALMSVQGRINGDTVVPANFTLETTENGQSAVVQMTMRGRAIVSANAEPGLVDRPDRIPVTAQHKRGVVDPLSAFVVALDREGPVSGPFACNRTVPVFDGWQRFDVRLAFKQNRQVEGSAGNYSGEVIVCSARYVPVAGHRPSQESVRYMAENDRIEVWLIPVEGQKVLVPFQLLIGTQVGDLIIRMSRFDSGAEQRAEVEPAAARQ